MQWEEKQQQDGRRTTFLDALRAYALFDIENGSESTGKWHLDMDNGDQKEDEEEKQEDEDQQHRPTRLQPPRKAKARVG
jgi:hypothetical protein